MTDASLPVLEPGVNPETQPFWRATAVGKLVLPQCTQCQNYIWYPRQFCPNCFARDIEWKEACGYGKIYSFTVIRRGAPTAFERVAPYAVGYVELEEGPRIYTNIVECDVDALRIGLAVEVLFHRLDAEVSIPRFRLAKVTGHG
jgi:uncharacterized protein